MSKLLRKACEEAKQGQWRSQRKMFGPASSAAGARVVGGFRRVVGGEMPFPAIWALTYESQFH